MASLLASSIYKLKQARDRNIIFASIVLLLAIANGGHAIKFDGENYGVNKEHILEASYHGLIKENETFVEITPVIKVDESQVCDFRIIKKSNHEIPFEIELVDNLAVLKATKTLNCEKHLIYRFEIVAILCDGSHSNSANVHVAVSDINEYSPVFTAPSYVIEVDEGRIYKEIIRVEATDRDCSPLFGDICKYEILGADSTDHEPFSIDKEGVIRNNVPLSHKQSQNHILSVVAYDCAMKQSAPVMVTIRVRRVCEARINGVPEHVNYTSSTSVNTALFPKLNLELCHMQCLDSDLLIQSTVTLQTKHISFGCDRDANKCFQQHNIIDLLPKFSQWTKDLAYDEGGSDALFHFDGNSGSIVPSGIISHHDFAMHPFSISTIFRHHSISTNDKHTKEHILCSADDHKMNRHHMALFVRNCRLILLLRKNFNEGDLNIFSPAEWRWKIPEVCDNEWHQYTVNVDLPKVELYIDGHKFEAIVEDRHSNPEVIDDWPLHAAHGINTTLTIGACYQGAENVLKHGFQGDIAEIKVTMQSTLSENEIKCTTECAEHLTVPSEHILEPLQQVQSNAQLNEIIVEGSNQSNIEKLLQNIQYINTKEMPTIGRRNIEVKTVVSCPGKKAIRLPTIDTYLMVMKDESIDDSAPTISANDIQMNRIEDSDKLANSDEKPQIIITGKQNHLVSYQDIKEGVHILANVNINVISAGQIQSELQKLDSCIVTVFPSLNPDHEQISMPKMENLSSTLDIKTIINKDGVEMIGFDSIVNYQAVLQSLVYTNKKPAYYLNRVFKLSCSQMNSHFRSAEYTLTITVLHPKQTATNAPVAKDANHQYVGASSQLLHEPSIFAHAMVHNHDVEEPSGKVHDITHKAQMSHATLLIIVIGISFFMLIFGIVVARMRSSNTRNGSALRKTDKHIPAKHMNDPQLDWDDSALTITINPMQNCSISDESSESENSDSEDEEITTNGRYRNVSQLEWDNSTI